MITVDPRTKLLMLLLISTSTVMSREWKFLIPLLMFSLLLVIVFSKSLLISFFIRTRKILTVFLIIAIIQSIFTKEGEVILSIGGIRILTLEGLNLGISLLTRMMIIILSGLIVASSPAMETVYGLIAMKIPYEIPFMVLIAIKFLPIFKEEFTDSLIALQLYGVNVKRVPMREKLSLYTYILTPSIVKALNRAKFISLSMECRGFRLYDNRTSYCKLKLGMKDYLFLGVTFITILILWLNR